MTDKLSSNISNGNTLPTTSKVELGDRRIPRNETTEADRHESHGNNLRGEGGNRPMVNNKTSEASIHDKPSQSQMNHMRGDPGVQLSEIIKSSDSRERKPVKKKLSKAGEF